MPGRVNQSDPLTPVLVVVAAALAIMVNAFMLTPKARGHGAEDAFNNRCLRHGFTADQCRFFAHGEDESPAAP